MNGTYFPQIRACIQTDDLSINFYRLYKDARDIMSDALKPDWTPVDDFSIEIAKLEPVGNKLFPGESFTVLTKDKQLANYIWWLGKHGTTYEQFKAMHEAKQF